MTATDPTAAVRWTEHGPEAVAGEVEQLHVPGATVDDVPTRDHDAAPVDATGSPVPEDLGAAWRRLAEKGLVREQPAVRIRELVPDAPRVVFEPEPLIVTGNEPDEALGDPEELEPALPGPSTIVKCPSCRAKHDVPDSSTGFKCDACAKVWRWAECGNCHDLNLTIARQESWRCKTCGGHTRSWWRTPTKVAEHRRIAEARAAQAADRRRRQAYEKARRRRWKLLTAGAVAILATSLGAINYSRHAAPVTSRGATGRVCDDFADVQRQVATQAPVSELRASLDGLAAEAVDAIDRVRIPAQQLAGAGPPGNKAFDEAAARLDRACAG